VDGLVYAKPKITKQAAKPLAPPTKSRDVGGAKIGRGKNWEGQEKTRGRPSQKSEKTNALPPPTDRQRSRRWIEFKPGKKRKDGTRMYYPKYRRWLPGNEKKEWLGPVADLDPMTEAEKNDYVNNRRKAEQRRKREKRRRSS
jgi:hypothetical protein